MDVGYKILTAIMAKRLKEWLERHNKFKESQNGFTQQIPTRDHVCFKFPDIK